MITQNPRLKPPRSSSRVHAFWSPSQSWIILVTKKKKEDIRIWCAARMEKALRAKTLNQTPHSNYTLVWFLRGMRAPMTCSCLFRINRPPWRILYRIVSSKSYIHVQYVPTSVKYRSWAQTNHKRRGAVRNSFSRPGGRNKKRVNIRYGKLIFILFAKYFSVPQMAGGSQQKM